MRPPRIHYAGALRYRHGRNGSRYTIILGGWAACCSGARAVAIRAARQHTYVPAEVTCATCRTIMAKAGIGIETETRT